MQEKEKKREERRKGSIYLRSELEAMLFCSHCTDIQRCNTYSYSNSMMDISVKTSKAISFMPQRIIEKNFFVLDGTHFEINITNIYFMIFFSYLEVKASCLKMNCTLRHSPFVTNLSLWYDY